MPISCSSAPPSASPAAGTPPGSTTPCPDAAPAGKGPFASADEAAQAALAEANPQSIEKNQEFGGVIYKNDKGEYFYTGPAGGTGTSFSPADAPAPAGTTVVGDYHTHGDYSTVGADGNPVRTSDPTKDDYNSDNFSTTDKDGIAADGKDTEGYAGYLGTPSGTFKKYDPATGDVTELEQPADE